MCEHLRSDPEAVEYLDYDSEPRAGANSVGPDSAPTVTTVDAVTPMATVTTVDTVHPVDAVDAMPAVAPVTCHVCTRDLEL